MNISIDTPLLAGLILAVLPALSAAADPKTISFTRVFPNGQQIGLFIAAADGSNERPLLGNTELDYDAVWSPDGATLVFTSEREGSADLYRVNPDGSGLERLTDDPAYDDQAAFSPDGKQLVFVSTRNGGYDNFSLWSPRGDLILFSRQTGGNYQVFTIKPDGTDARQLTFTHGNDTHMGWSPDGEYIAFTSSRMGFKDEISYTDSPQPYGEIFVMRFDGTNVQQLTDNQWEDGTPAWQPAGMRASNRL